MIPVSWPTVASYWTATSSQLTQNMLRMLLPCIGSVITLTEHSSNIVSTFYASWVNTAASG
uniref:Uncharacterized protein n=1 Tax=Anguilla anguilla TaxID=7936 RepID=A0A0E9WJ12_ANGAN